MTRFVGDAIGVRGGGSSLATGKDLKKNMQKFIETGVHPDVQKAQERVRAEAVPALPDHDANRDFVFIDLAVGKEPLGRLVVELYADLIPVGAHHLRNRCLPGSRAGLANAEVNKLQPHYAVWLGKHPAASEGMRLQPNSRLRHVELGAVSISLTGDDVAISLGRSMVLDSTHQVVGRVHKGREVLEALSDIPVNHFDVPLKRVSVARCGPTNALGVHEDIEAGGSKPKDPAARLAEATAGARQSLMHALAEGLEQKKRKAADSDDAAEEAGRSTAAAATAGRSKPAAGQRNVKAKYLDEMLGGLSDSGSDSGSSSEDPDADGDSKE